MSPSNPKAPSLKSELPDLRRPSDSSRGLVIVYAACLALLVALVAADVWLVAQLASQERLRANYSFHAGQQRVVTARLETALAAMHEGNRPGDGNLVDLSTSFETWRRGGRSLSEVLPASGTTDLAAAFTAAETAAKVVHDSFTRLNPEAGKLVGERRAAALAALTKYDQAADKTARAAAAQAEGAADSYRAAHYLVLLAGLGVLGAQAWFAFRPALLLWRAGLDLAQKGAAEQLRLQRESEQQALTATAALAELSKTQALEKDRFEHARARLVALLEHLPDCAAIARADMKLVFLNRAARQAAGLEEGEKLAGLALGDLFPPRLRNRLEHDLLPLVARDGHWRGEWTWGHKKGETAVSLELFAHRTSAGQVDAWLVLAKDPRHEQTARSAVLESEIRLRAMFESSLDAILTVNDAGKVLELNPAAEQLFGASRKEACERDFAELFVPQASRKRYRANLESYRTAGEGSLLGRRLELTMQRKGGQEFLGELAMQPSVLNGQPVYTVFVRDVTDRRRAEEKVKQSEERFRQLADAIDEVFFIASANGKEILYVSPAYERVWGRTCQSLLDHPGSWLKAIHADDRARVEADYFQSSPEASLCSEFRLQRPNKSWRWVRMCYYPVRSSTGDVIRRAAVATDITERKEAEEQIVCKNKDLETLLYVTSHDLREPLRAIENFATLVNDRYAASVDEKGRDYLSRVVRGAKRLDQLLDDVLTLSRAQRAPQVDETVNAGLIVESVLAQLDERIREKQAAVTVLAPLPNLHVDRRWVTQAVFNLVANALKFHQPGEPPQIEIAPYEGPEGVGLAIRDRGPGVASEHSERIFQLFQRAVGREVEGTGAGLAIVRQIAERHGGKAWHTPRTDGGSEFIITFGESGR